MQINERRRAICGASNKIQSIYRLVKVSVNFYWTTNSNTRFPHLFHYSLQFHIIWWSTREKMPALDSFNAQLDSLSMYYNYKLAIIWMFKRMKNDMFLQNTEGTWEILITIEITVLNGIYYHFAVSIQLDKRLPFVFIFLWFSHRQSQLEWRLHDATGAWYVRF